MFKSTFWIDDAPFSFTIWLTQIWLLAKTYWIYTTRISKWKFQRSGFVVTLFFIVLLLPSFCKNDVILQFLKSPLSRLPSVKLFRKENKKKIIYLVHYDSHHDQIDLMMMLIQVMFDHEQPLLHYSFLEIQYELNEDIDWFK